MKKILLSLGVVVFVAAASLTATGAFFSDTETSTGNTFTAGDIDLKIDNESYVTDNLGRLVASPNNSWEISDLTNQLFFSFGDVKPGDIGEDTISIHPGTNDAWACMAADITATPENTLVDSESDAGDVGPANGNNGELQNFLNFTFWKDDGDNVFEDNEVAITQLTGPASTIFNGSWLPLADASSTPALAGNSTTYVGKAWCFGTLTPNAVAQDGLGKVGNNGPLVRGTGFTCDGSGNNNVAQTDGVVVDVSFYAVQARNNAQFQCSSLPVFSGETPISWTTDGTRTGGSAMIIATTTESGDNALRLVTIEDTDSRVRYNYDISDINLSAFTGFSYDSNQVSANDMVNGNASFRLVVDLDGDLLTLGDVKDVTYEPYYNILAHNPLNDAGITPNVWQNWAATMADGKFWAGGVTTVLGPSEGAGGAYATNFTIAQLLDAYPSAKIIGISIGMGTYNVNQVVLVDNLIFNGNVLGFE